MKIDDWGLFYMNHFSKGLFELVWNIFLLLLYMKLLMFILEHSEKLFDIRKLLL